MFNEFNPFFSPEMTKEERAQKMALLLSLQRQRNQDSEGDESLPILPVEFGDMIKDFKLPITVTLRFNNRDITLNIRNTDSPLSELLVEALSSNPDYQNHVNFHKDAYRNAMRRYLESGRKRLCFRNEQDYEQFLRYFFQLELERNRVTDILFLIQQNRGRIIVRGRQLNLDQSPSQNNIREGQVLYAVPSASNGTPIEYAWADYYGIPIDSYPRDWNFAQKLRERTGNANCWKPTQLQARRLLDDDEFLRETLSEIDGVDVDRVLERL